MQVDNLTAVKRTRSAEESAVITQVETFMDRQDIINNNDLQALVEEQGV